MKLQDAQAIAQEVIAALAPACQRIEVAGGVRRHKPDPHDIEIVALPRFREAPLGFFDTQRVAETDEAISAASASGLLRLDSDVKRNGPRYKRFLSRGTETIVELFLVHDPAQWGVIFAIRTGPADFNQRLVTSRAQGGAMPVGAAVRDGWLTNMGTKVATREEHDYFSFIGVPYWPPEERTLAKLEAWLARGAGRGGEVLK